MRLQEDGVPDLRSVDFLNAIDISTTIYHTDVPIEGHGRGLWLLSDQTLSLPFFRRSSGRHPFQRMPVSLNVLEFPVEFLAEL